MLSKNAKWPKRSKRRKLSALLCSILLVSAIAGAAVVAPVPVFALSAGGIKGTIASIILSLLLQTGTAPTNTQWVDQLNNAYGIESSIGTIEDAISNGLLTETAEGLIDTGLSAAIEAAPEYTSLGLSDLFTTTAADAGVNAASGAVNLANTAIHAGTLGTIGAFAGAAAVGVGVGVIANHFYNKYQNFIRQGIKINLDDSIVNNVEAGKRLYYNCYGANRQNYYYQTYYTVPANMPVSAYNYSEYRYTLMGGSIGESTTYSAITQRSNDWVVVSRTDYTLRGNGGLTGYGGAGNWGTPETNAPVFPDRESALSYCSDVKSGLRDLNEPVAPDIITPLGNAQMIEGPDGSDVINGQGNIVPEGYDMSPVDVQDYLNFIDQANDNTENGDTGQEIQGEAFDDFVDPYLIPPQQEPDQPIIPENPDIPKPEYPDRPLTPDQPTVPDKPDATPEDITDMTDMMTTPELKSVFPFCIPWDLYNLFLIFDTGENRRAPHIVFTFPGTDWNVDVDLAQFDPVAALLRLLELIAFIAGLAVATRALIGANG